MLNFQKPSNYLIILSVIIILLGIFMSYLVRINVTHLQYNAQLINETGIIRGSIQRATKLVLADSPDKAKSVINEVDIKIATILKEAKCRGELKSFILKNFNTLNNRWKRLKILLSEYNKEKSEKNLREIINLSEVCWSNADDVVLNIQVMTQVRIGGIRIFYIILGMNILSAVIVILLVYLYIKKRLEYESSHDLLTDIYNKRSFERIIEYTVEHARRYNRPLSLILFDIDHFKNINDMYGHKTGDKVLEKLAALIKNSIRKCDTFFRVGGEEFAIICGETTAEDAFKLAEKLRKIVENNNFDDVGRVTISLGIAEMQKGCSIEELYRNADVAMYFAKRNGRNMSKIYSDDINSTFVQKKCVC